MAKVSIPAILCVICTMPEPSCPQPTKPNPDRVAFSLAFPQVIQ